MGAITRMKVVLVLLFAACVSAEWTCDDCKAASEALGVYTTTDDALNRMSEILVAELCPQAPSPDKCVEDLPGFWGSLAIYVFPEHYKHIFMTWTVQRKRHLFLA